MSDLEIHLQDNKTLEQLLAEQDDTAFPSFSKERSEKSYPKRYADIELALEKIHNSVEKTAMAVELENFINEKQKNSDKNLQDGLEEALIYLNNHGKDHVKCVIQRVSEILRLFPENSGLTPYEIFILLCAIQVHDTGNIFGRKKHERVIGPILTNECSKIIPDNIERKAIERIAMVHGGQIFGDKDTIRNLYVITIVKGKKIRERLLAALLKFGDELADDSTRADRYALEEGKIPKCSKIFHYYSQSLHTVSIIKNSENNEIQIELKYDFDSDIAEKKFYRNGKEKYLLDEIYDRTFKMEQERRYCMRFLLPYFFITSIKVDINISHVCYVMINDKINYVLEEKGYPNLSYNNIKEINQEIHSGDEVIQYFKSHKDGIND